MMMEEHGSDRCIIVGSSAHNERIEHLGEMSTILL